MTSVLYVFYVKIKFFIKLIFFKLKIEIYHLYIISVK